MSHKLLLYFLCAVIAEVTAKSVSVGMCVCCTFQFKMLGYILDPVSNPILDVLNAMDSFWQNKSIGITAL